MKGMFRFPLILLVTGGVLLSGCNQNSHSTVDRASDLEAAFIKGPVLSAAFQDSRLEGMKGIAENESLRLFVDDKTGNIAVLNKKTQDIFFSNPQERGSDAVAAGLNKDLLSAQLKLDFYNSFGQLNSVNSYSDSVVYDQVNYELVPNGLKVHYRFGKAAKSADDLPMMMSKSRFEELLLSKLDKTGQRAVMIAYTEDKNKEVFVRNDKALKGLQLDRALAAFEEVGYTEEDLEYDINENNLSQAKPEARIFLASIEYTLDSDQLVVKVPVSSIQYPKEFPINRITVLSFFGAGGQEEKGSLFVPDGSGALIHFNNGKSRYPAYQQDVYGPDLAKDEKGLFSTDQKVRLPVFGVLKENRALFGIIEEGASAATINADVSGKLNSYNTVYPSFYVVNKGDISLSAPGANRSLPQFQEEPTKSDFTIRYTFLSGKDASYSGMAAYYRQYLVKNNLLAQAKESASPEDTPFYLQLIGGITKTKHFAGIPYDALEPLTTFDQAKLIISQMKDLNINNIKLKYSGWFNEGYDHEVLKDISVDSAIGGKKGFKSFMSFAEEQGVSLFPDVSLVTANQTSGFRKSKEAARMLDQVPAALYPVDLATGRRDRNRNPSYLISPRYMEGYVDTMLNKLAGYQTDGVSLRDLANLLSSDYRENKQIDRTESEQISKQSLTKMKEAGLAIMAEGGNSYALPYLSDLTHVPLSNSKYKLEDEAVPFYQMVVRGSIDYTGEPYNLSTYTNPKQYVLKCLEYGSQLHFEWIYAPNYAVKDTDYDYLYSVNYEQWIGQAAEMYQEVNAVLKQVKDRSIRNHEKLAEGVYKTTYDNGFYVIVNYNRSKVTVDGVLMEAESYTTGGDRS